MRFAIRARSLYPPNPLSLLCHHAAALPLLSSTPRRLTSKDDQPKAPLSVTQHTAPQQHVLVAQGKLAVLPVEGPAELVQLIVGRLTDDFTCMGNIRAPVQYPVYICSLLRAWQEQ